MKLQKLLNLVNEKVFEMKLKLTLDLFGISKENMYIEETLTRLHNLKVCLQPEPGAQKVEKH